MSLPYCDVVIYKKYEYIFGLPPDSGTELLTPFEFPKRRE